MPSGRCWEMLQLRAKPYSHWVVELLMKTWASGREQITLKQQDRMIHQDRKLSNSKASLNLKVTNKKKGSGF